MTGRFRNVRGSRVRLLAPVGSKPNQARGNAATRPLLATALLLSTAVLTACGDDETSSASAGARSAANAYVAAIADGRSADVCAALSTAARAELTHGRSGCAKAARRQLSPGLVKGVSVQKVEVDGVTATVTLRS